MMNKINIKELKFIIIIFLEILVYFIFFLLKKDRLLLNENYNDRYFYKI
jgi:hypothetical protein